MNTPFRRLVAGILVTMAALSGCREGGDTVENTLEPIVDVEARLARYATVRLDADLSSLTSEQRRMVRLFIEAAEAMDRAFWKQAWGDRDALLERIRDPAAREYALLNYGPWDRLAGNEPFLSGVGPKPPGARFFPPDMTKDAFDRALAAVPDDLAEALRSHYTVVRRDEDGGLRAVPYHEEYAEEVRFAADRLQRAAALARDPGLRRYLELRARALVTDDYRPSDMAWMEMKDNVLDLVIGPIETYEESVCGCKAAFEAYVLVKDLDWSRRLERYAALLPQMQRGLPVPARYKREMPGTDSDLGAYDALFYAGDCNAGAKTIAINLPNDETVQLEKGSRRLQLKNAMRAKFDAILVPIADLLVAPAQRKHVTFDAFFANTMFHEVAHGLGVKNVVDGSRTVDEALADRHSAIEEGKADVLGLYLVRTLHALDELDGADLMDYYVTFAAGLFRSIRFGAASAHGRANLVRYNFFAEQGAFGRDGEGRLVVDPERMGRAIDALAARLLTIQGDGDYEAAGALEERYGRLTPELQAALDRIEQAGIPVDIRFEQGLSVLGDRLEPADD